MTRKAQTFRQYHAEVTRTRRAHDRAVGSNRKPFQRLFDDLFAKHPWIQRVQISNVADDGDHEFEPGFHVAVFSKDGERYYRGSGSDYAPGSKGAKAMALIRRLDTTYYRTFDDYFGPKDLIAEPDKHLRTENDPDFDWWFR